MTTPSTPLSQYGSPELQAKILERLATPALPPLPVVAYLRTAPDIGTPTVSARFLKVHPEFKNEYCEPLVKLSDALAAIASQGDAVISAYSIATSDKSFAEEIVIQRMRQIDGPPLWSVKLGGNCLNKSGEWEWEPMPSSRDDVFLARCRFASAQEAIAAAITAKDAK